jgi:predicted transcriptional regulator
MTDKKEELRKLKGCRIKDFIEADKTLFLIVEKEKKVKKKRGKYKKKKITEKDKNKTDLLVSLYKSPKRWKELEEKLGISEATLKRYLDELLENKFVKKIISEDKVKYAITPQGVMEGSRKSKEIKEEMLYRMAGFKK